MVGISQSIPWILNQQFWDKNGCFVILKGKLNTLHLTLVGIYAPNQSQAPFLEGIYKELMEDLSSEVLMMGDVNVVLDDQQDRSKDSSAPVLSATFHKYKR